METWTFLCAGPLQAQYEEEVSSYAWVWGTELSGDFSDPWVLWGLQDWEGGDGGPSPQDGGSGGDACLVEGEEDRGGFSEDCVLNQ